MVVVRWLILCSKFAKNRLSAGLRPDPLGELTAVPQTPELDNGGDGGERGEIRAGRGGKERVRGKERAGMEDRKREKVLNIQFHSCHSLPFEVKLKANVIIM